MLIYTQDKEKVRVEESRLTQVYLHRDFTHYDFVQLLKSEGQCICYLASLLEFEFVFVLIIIITILLVIVILK